jgi:hypothetical protein
MLLALTVYTKAYLQRVRVGCQLSLSYCLGRVEGVFAVPPGVNGRDTARFGPHAFSGFCRTTP